MKIKKLGGDVFKVTMSGPTKTEYKEGRKERPF